MTFLDGLHKKAEVVNEHLKSYFNDGINNFENKLHESMQYSLLAGGKRIRPIILMETGKLFGANHEELIDYACALEMIHTYSLIHDDLPAMDDDDLRRGKPTNHKVYGEAIAILAGDALLNSAYELMSLKADEYQDFKFIKALNVISTSSGRKGMIGGQIADIESEHLEGDKQILEYIHMNKTSAIITAAFVAGGIIGKADETELLHLEKLGNNIGLMFQIKDDILDIESDELTLGKPIGSDEKNKKMTYPSLYGLDESKLKIEILYKDSIDIINKFNGECSFLLSLVEFLKMRKH